MGIEALRSAVEKAARDRVVGVLDDARENARALREKATSEVMERNRQVLRDEEVRLRREVSTRVAAERVARQKRVLEARQMLLDRVFTLAKEQLPSIFANEPVRAWIADLAEEALRHMPQGPVVIECSDTLVEPLQLKVAGRDEVRVQSASDVPEGFRARAREGTLVVDVTLTRLLDLHRPSLSIDVLQRFEGAASS